MRGSPDPATPLWRAAQVFRLLSCLYALGFQIAVNPRSGPPGVALGAVRRADRMERRLRRRLSAGLRPRRASWVLAEVVVVVALILSTEFVASRQWALDNQSLADDPVGDQRHHLGGHPARARSPGMVCRSGGDDRE